MKTIKGILDNTLEIEGSKFTDDPDDRGGPTRWGITQATARADGYTGDMRDLSRERAYDILYRKYVIAPGFERVGLLDMTIAAELVDTGVNMGPAVAARFLQRALNYFQGDGLAEDGKIGPATLRSLTGFAERRGTVGLNVLLSLLNAQQAMRYVELVEKSPSQRKFAYGWMANRVAV